MRVPLEFRLLLLAALGLRLLVSARKYRKTTEKKFESFLELPDFQHSDTNEDYINLVLNHKYIFRNVVRGKESENRFYFLIFLIQKLEKSISKGGIYRFFWFDAHLVPALYESLIFLEMEEEKEKFGEILKHISPDEFTELKNRNYSNITAHTFQVDGDAQSDFFEGFDKVFILRNFIEKTEKMFFGNHPEIF